jgi:ubiquinone/menaquinone biosynthesis C-methylase UbiE
VRLGGALNDPAAVSAQYATESNLEARRSIYTNPEGPDPREITFAAVGEIAPRFVLEVGGGPGELAARIQEELGATVVMVDSSPRMVELARQRGVDALLGDVQDLPFADGKFDCVVAAWMLFHVPALDRGLAEIVRVLKPQGRLVATTNAESHLHELRRIAGAAWTTPFSRENGAEILGPYFERIERRDADGWVTIEDEETIRGFVASLGGGVPAKLPTFELPLRSRRASSVFVADRA